MTDIGGIKIAAISLNPGLADLFFIILIINNIIEGIDGGISGKGGNEPLNDNPQFRWMA